MLTSLGICTPVKETTDFQQSKNASVAVDMPQVHRKLVEHTATAKRAGSVRGNTDTY